MCNSRYDTTEVISDRYFILQKHLEHCIKIKRFNVS